MRAEVLSPRPARARGGMRPLGLLILLLFSLLLGCGAKYPSTAPGVRIPEAHSAGTVLDFDPTGARLASGGRDGLLRLWEPRTGESLGAWRAHEAPVTGLRFLPSGELVSSAYDGTIMLWSAGGSRLGRADAGTPATALVVDAPRRRVMTGHEDGSLRAWSLPGLEPSSVRRRHAEAVRALALHGETGMLASSGADGRVMAGPLDGQPVALETPPGDVYSLAFSKDGHTLFGGGWFRLYRWGLREGSSLDVLATEHWGLIHGLDTDPVRGRIASISRETDSSVYLIGPQSGATLQYLGKHQLCGAEARFSRDGRYLATTGDDAEILIWDLGS